ncbi:MAG TPA: SpoIVB peptidase [Tissierellales bacterium]|nr:SpoIVB peptidase [Tissierellales bacterium]
MRKFKNRKIFSIFFLIIAFFYMIQIASIFYCPKEIRIVKGEDKELELLFPFRLKNRGKENKILETTFNLNNRSKLKRSYNIVANQEGNAKFNLNILGFIPVKNVDVNVVDRQELILGGNSIGVSLNTKGVLVVAVTDIIGIDGKNYNPARTAGIKAGDSIIDINGEKVKNAEHVVQLLNDLKDSSIKITIERNGANFVTSVTPVQSLQDNCYRLGIWVRDKTAGIGTLTFYDEKSKNFGALGHGITDIDTGKLLNVRNGKIMDAKIANIEQGKKGEPGEIKGIFYETENTVGDIKENTNFGIYGKLNDEFIKNNRAEALPIGFRDEVKEGKAYILTTINDNKIQKYEIEILKKQQQFSPESKSMVIKITDEKLLNKTGGIVQGMSGSPIIQDDKIIGAVTHVFVNDPTKGYGLYIEWMLEQLSMGKGEKIGNVEEDR